MKKKSIVVIVFACLTAVIMIMALTGLIDETIGMCTSLSMMVLLNIVIAIFAYRHDVKFITVLMVIFMAIGLILLGINLYTIFQDNITLESEFRLVIEEDDSEKSSMFSNGEFEFYTYRLSKVDVSLGKMGTYTLKNAIEEGHITLDKILSYAIPNENTEGYKIYYDGGEGGNESNRYSVITCADSNEVIFAPYDYNYDGSLCSSNDAS